MRVLFLIPPRTTTLNRDFAATQLVPSVGIASMIGGVIREFPDVTFLDAYAEGLTPDAAVRRILDFRPDLVAMSALTIQVHDAAETARALKGVDPRIRVVVGGPHTSKIPEETLREFPVFDFAAAGEGEGIMRELLPALRDGGRTDNIPGLYSVEEGNVVSGGARPYITDLNSLEFPDWKHFNWDAYCASFRLKKQKYREISVSINRGCPFDCIFCSKIMGSRLRKRSIHRVIEEIQRNVRDFGANQILFTDETFTVDRAGVAELCESIIREGLHEKISWIADTRPDMVDEELLTLIKRSGCFFICFGADSVSDETLKYMKKNADAASIYNAIRLSRKCGLTTQAAYIMGLPTDSPASIRETVRGALAVNSDFATFSILVPYPGTKIMEMAEKGEGLVLLTKDWRLYGKQLGNALETSRLSRPVLEKLQRRAYYRYYLRPSKIFNIFRIADVRVVLLYFIAHLLRKIGLSK